MATSKYTTPRLCADCAADISDRGNRAVRCAKCAKVNKHRRHTEWYREKHGITVKLCGQCGEDISYRHRVAEYCEPCAKDRKREREREKLTNNLDFREVRRLACSDYYERKSQDPEWKAETNRKGREWQRNKYHSDPEYKRQENARRVATRKRQYHNDPAFRRRIIDDRRMRKPWDGTVNRESIAALLKSQKGKCACCRINIRSKYHLDHIFPLSKGGLSTLENCQLLCPTCNSRKHASLVYFPPSGGQGRMALGR